MYIAALSFLSGATFFYIGYYRSEIEARWNTPVKVLRRLPPVSQYTQLFMEENENKYLIYSRHHKCALSTHELINKKTLDQQLKIKDQQTLQISEVTIINAQGKTNAIQDNQKIQEITVEANEHKNRTLFQRLYKEYARQLIQNKICNSVQLIYGPIFSKDTPYKIDKEVIKNVYTSHVRIAKDGEWLTDRFYTIVACNRNEGTYVNGFSHRKSNYPTFRFLNYLTSLKKLEEQTGLVFKVKGEQLTRIDYAGISKQRFFEPQQEAPKEISKEQLKENL